LARGGVLLIEVEVVVTVVALVVFVVAALAVGELLSLTSLCSVRRSAERSGWTHHPGAHQG
jgi:hypothetical protein